MQTSVWRSLAATGILSGARRRAPLISFSQGRRRAFAEV